MITVNSSKYRIRISLPQSTSRKIARMAVSTAPQVVDLHGWDLCFAIRMPDANRAIADAWKGADPGLPRSFKGAMDGNVATATGTFGAWQLAQGGASTIVKMKVPLGPGKLTFSGRDCSFDQGMATISVQLGFIPRTNQDNSKPNDLTIKAAPVPSPKPVTVDDLVFSGPQPDPLVSPFLRPILESWFASNMAEFRYVFATVYVDALATNQAWQWLKPSSVGFAWAQPNPASNPPDDACILGVLATVGGRDGSNLDLALDLGVIPGSCKAGLVVGSSAYYSNNFIPHVDQSFDAAKAADFSVVASDSGSFSVTNVNEVKLKLPQDKERTKFRIASLAPHGFSATLLASEIQMRVLHAHVPISPGIDLYFNYTAHVGCKLIRRQDGTQVISLYDSQPVEQDHEVQVAEGVTVSAILAGLIAGLLLVGVGGVAGDAAASAFRAAEEGAAETVASRIVNFVVRGVVTGLPAALIGSIPQIIEAVAQGNAEKMPPFDPFMDEAVSSTVWSGGKYKGSQVGFNGGLQIGLMPASA